MAWASIDYQFKFLETRVGLRLSHNEYGVLFTNPAFQCDATRLLHSNPQFLSAASFSWPFVSFGSSERLK
jgi:hypothetical protein